MLSDWQAQCPLVCVLALLPLAGQRTYTLVYYVVDDRILLALKFSDSSTNLLRNSSSVFAWVAEYDPITTRNVQSFVCKLCCKDASNPARSKVRQNSSSFITANIANEDSAFASSNFSKPLKVFNSATKDEHRISTATFSVNDIGNLLIPPSV